MCNTGHKVIIVMSTSISLGRKCLVWLVGWSVSFIYLFISLFHLFGCLFPLTRIPSFLLLKKRKEKGLAMNRPTLELNVTIGIKKINMKFLLTDKASNSQWK